MKLLAIVTTPFYREKGSSMRVHAVLSHLGCKYSVDAVTYPHGRDVSVPNVKIHRTTPRYCPKIGVSRPTVSRVVLDLLVLCKAAVLAARKRYQVIHCEDFEALVIGRLVRLVRPCARLVYDMHNPIGDNLALKGHPKYLVAVARAIERLTLRGVDLVILNWRIYENDPRYSHLNRFVHYDRVPLAKSPPPERIESPYMIYAGNFEAYQGVDSLLDAYARVRPRFKLVLVGPAPPGLRHRVAEYGLTGAVLCTGSLPVEQTNSLISDASWFAVPRLEGPSMKVAHALVFEKPVFAQSTHANGELLRNGYNAVLYRDFGELTDWLGRIDADRELPHRLLKGVLATRKTILQTWDRDSFLTQYCKKPSRVHET